ncbi:hypothetical protein ABW21_db0204901 [Orbilia brochopaga]|nr:hypothetical protein ABW21_db0204901 [Drechslerella brochopaga]
MSQPLDHRRQRRNQADNDDDNYYAASSHRSTHHSSRSNVNTSNAQVFGNSPYDSIQPSYQESESTDDMEYLPPILADSRNHGTSTGQRRAQDLSSNQGSNRAIMRLTASQNVRRLINVISDSSQSLMRELNAMPIDRWPEEIIAMIESNGAATIALFNTLSSHRDSRGRAEARALAEHFTRRVDEYYRSRGRQ